jgi:hypothetical protein
MVLPLLVTEMKLAVIITPLKLLQKNHIGIATSHAVLNPIVAKSEFYIEK